MDDPRNELAARYVAVLVLRETGDLQDAAHHASAMMELAEKLRDQRWLVSACWMSETVSAGKGDWLAARSYSDRGLLVSPGAAILLSTRVVLEYEVGQFDEGARFLERLLDAANAAPDWPVFDHAGVAMTIPVIARVTGATDRFDVAEKAAETIISSTQPTPRFLMHANTGLALMAVMLGDKTACEKWYDQVLSAEEIWAYPLVEGHLLGLLAQVLGNLDKARDHFEDALAICRPSGRRPELARLDDVLPVDREVIELIAVEVEAAVSHSFDEAAQPLSRLRQIDAKSQRCGTRNDAHFTSSVGRLHNSPLSRGQIRMMEGDSTAQGVTQLRLE